MDQQKFSLKFRDIPVDGYERVVEVKDEESGLHAIIALHDTRLGPALGGVRAYPYENFDDALTDVLRLSKGMTYKAAVAQTGTGGGKSVILTKKNTPKSKNLLFAFADAVNQFAGHYICAEDIGMSIDDLAIVRQRTRYAVGLPHPSSSGDPSPFTAWGGFRGIQAAVKAVWDTDVLQGKTFAIQGLGSVGMKLASYLFWAGANLIVTDVDASRCEYAAKQYGATVVSPSEILSVTCDVLSPCALGGILNSKTIPHLHCKAIAGLANNQLLTEEDGLAVHQRGILYAPDYVINSGGLLNVCAELFPEGYSPRKALEQVNQVYQHLLNIFQKAKKESLPTNSVANAIADENLARSIGRRSQEVIFHH